jgi:hypothetical protein
MSPLWSIRLEFGYDRGWRWCRAQGQLVRLWSDEMCRNRNILSTRRRSRLEAPRPYRRLRSPCAKQPGAHHVRFMSRPFWICLALSPTLSGSIVYLRMSAVSRRLLPRQFALLATAGFFVDPAPLKNKEKQRGSYISGQIVTAYCTNMAVFATLGLNPFGSPWPSNVKPEFPLKLNWWAMT